MEKLMIPGPGEISPLGLAEMAKPVLPHYGKEFLKLYNEVRNHMKEIFRTKGDVIILTDPGSAAMELSISSLTDKKILLVNSGFFSARWKEIIHSYGGETVDVTVKEHRAIDPCEIEKIVKRNKDIGTIAVVHNETSTGVINPIKEIGKISWKYNLLLVVDAVSSLGGGEFRMDEWNIDIAFTGSQKALGGPPGLSPVAINNRAWKFIKKNKKQQKGWYLNLLTWKNYIDNWAWHPYPTSLATPLIASFRVILAEVLKEGLEKRFERHRVASKAFRSGLRKMGLKLYPESEIFASPTITAFYPPEDIAEEKVRNVMLKDYNIRIAGGIGTLSGQIIRVGHMARTSDFDYILPTLAALEVTFKKLGFRVAIGNAVKSACEEFFL